MHPLPRRRAPAPAPPGRQHRPRCATRWAAALGATLLTGGLPGLATATATATAAAPSHVHCELHYGGDTYVVDAQPTADPYRVPTHEIGSYFLFKLVWQNPANRAPDAKQHRARIGKARDPASDSTGTLNAYTYADLPQGPTLLHQLSTTPAALQREAAAAASRKSASGAIEPTAWHRVHEPMRDGELRYRCSADAAARRTLQRAGALHATPVPVTATPVEAPRIRLDGDRPSVKLTFVGDLMLDDGPGRLIARGGDPLAPFAPILATADVVIGNLETPIAAPTTGKALDSKIYTFRSSPEVMRVLKGRFHALSVANNHSGDYGHPAFLETLAHLRSAGIHAFGGGPHLAQAHAPLWIEKAGAGPDGTNNPLKIAILAYNEFKPRSFEAGPHWPGVAWSEDEQVIADIHAARRAGAHVVIPFMHWGWERERTPGPRQRALARRMIEVGADAIVGGHPHVTQGSSVIRGKPVIWSLGNFVFDGFEELPAAQVGWLLEMEIDRRGVRRWRTVEARMDGDGTPWPVRDAVTPSGVR